uniref:ATP synthase complex subunit 8 n=1 Tax=Iso hawaiiensis TaxID=492020 RepID=B5BQ76_9TELE|nr:ATP synthase F0 subunit 8 [Iso hawaiiensis]BAG69263.1 ATPase subunit 8 [Iso hawaiiensis]
MPQLNPLPWFLFLFISWTVFAFIIPPKVLAHNFPNDPLATTAEKTKTQPWAWQWH